MPGIVLQLLDLQLYLMRRQQVAHDPADHPVFDVIAVIGEGDRLQPRRLVAGVVAGVMPARQQAVGGKPVALVVFARMVEQVGGLKQIA